MDNEKHTVNSSVCDDTSNSEVRSNDTRENTSETTTDTSDSENTESEADVNNIVGEKFGQGNINKFSGKKKNKEVVTKIS